MLKNRQSNPILDQSSWFPNPEKALLRARDTSAYLLYYLDKLGALGSDFLHLVAFFTPNLCCQLVTYDIANYLLCIPFMFTVM